MRILITGGAGFVGASLAEAFKSDNPRARITALDNLKRRGSEINLPRLKKMGVDFVHGDVRAKEDLFALPGRFDLMIEASAEPSVLAGQGGDPSYVVETNLCGTLNCLEFARLRAGALVFLSTSRVYSIDSLRAVRLQEKAGRFEIAPKQSLPGVGRAGIAESFPTHLPRSFYGATKLCSEMMIQEYCRTYGLKAVVNRCGVLAGPGQFGKTDQGVFAHWMAAHYFGKPLSYIGFKGGGKQVRDILHPRDLFALLQKQLRALPKISGEVYNIGGGTANAVSLLELTELCRKVSGRAIPIGRDPKTSPVDIPLYISDNAKAKKAFGWAPRISARAVAEEIHGWLRENERRLREVFN
ncbi:MAG TPA: NAD-dependent epimerase/dehydratase family protein [Elusimicrobiota bacterium]|nr:NAD-dependent epimerase/dehydratase family protein [Elusimicrobiota bacterium]